LLSGILVDIRCFTCWCHNFLTSLQSEHFSLSSYQPLRSLRGCLSGFNLPINTISIMFICPMNSSPQGCIWSEVTRTISFEPNTQYSPTIPNIKPNIFHPV